MVELIVGKKGKGKTKIILDMVNKEVNDAKGNIVYLDKSMGHMYELNNKVRLINVLDYEIANADEFIGIVLEFPSPFRGLYLQISHWKSLARCTNWFPSPFRGLYLQILSSTPTVFLHSQEYYAWESKLYMEI